MNNNQELSFVEGQVIPWGGTFALADAIERGNGPDIDREIQQCDPQDRYRLYQIATQLIEQIHQ
ncbi:hypothetical protein [Spirulina sp. 06S082]|uniref:hypothetical protein n=1 Tax=Spirulina sp. 06S082 TaxID=3110248 RepID=UPI002B1EF7CA|nr:hypothetical protein [Spirulina sp. 06S082]MEA5469347.1 hypothetical protein [Spirulina sp. 06S082]